MKKTSTKDTTYVYVYVCVHDLVVVHVDVDVHVHVHVHSQTILSCCLLCLPLIMVMSHDQNCFPFHSLGRRHRDYQLFSLLWT